jgi:hypothetical protein
MKIILILLKFIFFFTFLVGLYFLWLSLINYELYFDGIIRIIQYYIAPLLVVLISVFALLSSNEWRISIFISLMFPVITLYGYEYYLTKKSNNIHSDLELEGGTVVEKYIESDGKILPFIHPGIESVGKGIKFHKKPTIPLSGISKVWTAHCNEGGYVSIYKSDRFGFNNLDDKYNANSLYKIAMVGDSFTHGACVSPKHNLPSNLQNKIKHNVFNFGMSGIGPLATLGIVKEYLPSIKPSHVVWVHYEGNDLHDLRNEMKNSVLIRYVDSSYTQNLINRSDEINNALKKHADSVVSKYLNIKRKTKIKKKIDSLSILLRLEFLKLTKTRIKFGIAFGPSEFDSDLYRKIISEAKRTVEDWGGKIYFVYLPANQRKSANSISDMGWNYSKNKVLKVIHDMKIKTVDMSNILHKENPDNLYYYTESHFNPEGYEYVASKIASELKDVF